MKAERKTEPHSVREIAASSVPASGRSRTDDNGGDSAAEKPRDAETRDQSAKMLRPPPSCAPDSETWNLGQSEVCWSHVPWSFRGGGQGRQPLWCIVFWEINVNVGDRGSSRNPPSSNACWDFCLFHPFRISKNGIEGQEQILPSLSRAAVRGDL